MIAIEGGIDYYKQGLRIVRKTLNIKYFVLQTPQSDKLLYNIACSYEKIGKHENSIRWLRHLLDVDPHNSDAHFGLALNYFKTHRYPEAVKNINEALDHY